MFPEGASVERFGRYEEERLAEIKDVMVRWRKVKRELPLEKLYTNAYIPALSIEPKSF